MTYIAIFTNGSTKKKREFVEDVAWWFLGEKLPRFKSLNIEIDLVNIEDADGTCVELDKREFHIEIDKSLTGENLLTCILHELTHVKQHLKNLNDIKEADIIPYNKRPYEIEAYKEQEILAEEYINKNGITI